MALALLVPVKENSQQVFHQTKNEEQNKQQNNQKKPKETVGTNEQDARTPRTRPANDEDEDETTLKIDYDGGQRAT